MPFSTPGIFNVLDPAYGMIINGDPVRNAAALQAAIDAAQASGNPYGAIVLIPSTDPGATTPYSNYPIGVGTGGSTVIAIPAPSYTNAPLLICGTGNGTELLMQTGTPSSGQTVLFDVADTANVTFQDLTIRFDKQKQYVQTGVAFNFSGGASHKLFRVNVQDCQYPVVISGTNRANISQCIFTYNSFDTTIQDVAVLQVMGASQTFIGQCILNYNKGGSAYQSDYIAIVVAESSFTAVRDTQCTGFGKGIVVGDNTEEVTASTRFSGVRVSSFGPVVTVQPAVYDLSFVDCHFQADGNYTGSGPGISIGQAGDSNQYLDTIRFTACTLISNYGVTEDNGAYGMAIYAGQNIQVNGGKFSGCGATAGITIGGSATEIQIIGASCIGPEYGLATQSTPEPLYQLYGILISAGQDIQIVNVNCSGSGTVRQAGYGIYISPANDLTISNVKIIGAICTNPVLQETGSSVVMQEYGVYASGVSNLLIHGCTLTGNSVDGIYLEYVSEAIVSACDLYSNEQGMYVGNGCSSVFIRDNNISGYASLDAAITFASSPSLTAVEVTDCAGYNDQQPVLHGPSAPPSGLFNGVSLYGYYGPTTFYLSQGVQAVYIDGHATQLSSGTFDLGPQEYAKILVSNHPGTFLMIGI